MGLEAPDFDENDRTYLGLIQGVVSRLAGNQFLIKGWCLTVAAALLGYSAAHRQWSVALLGMAIVAGFAGLDAWFLRQERLFRHLWADAVARPRSSDLVLYSLNVAPYRARVPFVRSHLDENGNRRAGVVWSAPIAVLYGMLLAACIIVLVATAV
ncbi:hypothetical protein ACSMXN_07205 [Jatrophihabitans sp. DSM 45814]